MAIQEHAYYGSFGYHVTNYFAVSSRQGNPDEFKYLVDRAHSMGIRVIIDIVHSHASNNVLDGINRFDGTDHCYSHAGEKGHHKAWDSMIFDYSKYEVMRFLLSNLAWYITEYQIDGFRFDAVTSIMYQHHGVGVGFSGNYQEYFGYQVDLDGISYLMLANELIHTLLPDAMTVAEDVSGMPTLCRAISEGGIGFDYRLSMFLPDLWIKNLKELKDEEWNMGQLVHSMTNRRWKEKCVAYCESHDQAIVGDKTIAQWLLGGEIYSNMKKSAKSIVIDRGIAIHKMIRLLTISLGGEAYLNFMGNEFGHPEWIDFPREGNNFSYHYCRRQWNLLDDHSLKFEFLLNFDILMNKWVERFQLMSQKHQFVSLSHEEDKIIVYEKGDLLFVFNFHPTKSFENYKVGTSWDSDHIILFDSDSKELGGHDRLAAAKGKRFVRHNEACNNRRFHVKLYVPNRTCIVLIAEQNCDNRVNELVIETPKIMEVTVDEEIPIQSIPDQISEIAQLQVSPKDQIVEVNEEVKSEQKSELPKIKSLMEF